MFKKSLLGIALFSLLSTSYVAQAQDEALKLRFVYPGEGVQVDEDAVFALEFNQPIEQTSLENKVVCVIDGIGEQVPVRVLDESEKKVLWDKHLSWVSDNVDNVALIQCGRTLSSGGKVSLRLFPELQSKTGQLSTQGFTYNYEVREPFAAKFQCVRVNPKANCSPLGDLTLQFNSLVPYDALTQKVQVLIDGKALSPYQDEKSNSVYRLLYKGPFKPEATIEVKIEEGLQDDMQRLLSNEKKFPLQTKFDQYPPLLKFATGNFGIIETYAHTKVGEDLVKHPALIPLTVRNVEKNLKIAQEYRSGTVAQFHTQNDAEVRKWLNAVSMLNSGEYSQEDFNRILSGQALKYDKDEKTFDARNLSALSHKTGVSRLNLPNLSELKNETEVIGLPVNAPGFYVFEADSPLLGEQLTSDAKPMYVRSTALVTNMAVHLKTSETGALVWVTRLDDAKVIPNAKVRLSACNNKEIATGTTNEQGVFEFKGKLPELTNCLHQQYAYMASATLTKDHPMSYGAGDYSFVFSDWDKGIQPWQFNVVDERAITRKDALLVHPILSRTLLRAGETLDIKHIIRQQTPNGLKTPDESFVLPDQLALTLSALDEEIELPLSWKTAANGSLYAETQWNIPKTAKNGVYEIMYRHTSGQELKIESPTVSFQVEEFKLPFLKGSIQVSSSQQEGMVLINPSQMTADIKVDYMAGGAASELPIEVSAVYIPSEFFVPTLDDVDFSVIGEEQSSRKVFLDKQRVRLDANGHTRLTIENIPRIYGKADLLIEVSFLDPNGQVQTISHTVPAVQAPVMTGIRSASYFEPNSEFSFDVVAVNPLGEARPNEKVSVKATRIIENVVRQRLVGGFYAVQSTQETQDLNELCQGITDERGVLTCTVQIKEEGLLNLSAIADDYSDAPATQTPLWVYKGASWYTGNDTDRVDVIADKASYRVGDEAVFDVRIPFAEATALVSVEREGIIDYRVVQFEKNSSSFKLKIEKDWTPNVYVSVLSLRGRIRGDTNDAGKAWLKDETQAQGASTLVDLAKPSFRFGVSKIKVDNPETHIDIALNLDKSLYQVREKARLKIEAKRENGEKLAKANAVVLVVDKALLELAENETTDLFQAMWPERAWQVRMATAQGEVVGRRHYGRKAVPAGGGGGLAPTRELFDALVFWKSDIVLDENGEAIIDFTLNDSITQFEVVVVVDDGASAFGTQKADLSSRQDLQIISGLPTLIRDTDKFDAIITLRNATEHDLTVWVKGEAKKGNQVLADLAEKKVSVLAGRTARVTWAVEPIALNDMEGEKSIDWVFEAKAPVSLSTPSLSEKVKESSTESLEKIDVSALGIKMLRDRLSVKQSLIPYVPVTVRQTQLLQLAEEAVNLKVQAPTRAMTINGKVRGGIQVQMQKSLVEASLDGVKRYFQHYPYSCFEQQASKAMGLHSPEAWNSLMQESHSYMDDFGLLRYYPSERLNGSPLLNAYILAIAADARRLGWSFTIPEQIQEKLLVGLEQVVQGKIKQHSDWIANVDKVDYELNLLAALARYNLVTEQMLEKYPLMADYSASALVNLYIIHRYLETEGQAEALKTLRQALLSKMELLSDRLVFKDAESLDKLWWLMEDNNAVHAKLLLAVADDDAWRQEVPQLVQGLLGTQQRGQWGMTTNNLWGTLALNAFSYAFEKTSATGEVDMSMKGVAYEVAQEWNGLSLNQTIVAPWLDKREAELSLQLKGEGTVWATVSSLAAVDPVENIYAGYRVEKIIEPISRRIIGQWSVGDVYRVKLKITANAPMTWVAVTDPIPSGATILGSGLGRDSAIALENEAYNEASFIERKADVFRAYYQWMDEGVTELEYTVRLNTLGKFALPPTRVEAMYAPAIFGESVNSDIWVKEP